MNDTLQHRLDAARHEQFVGRADHLSRFREVLLAPELPVHVVYVCGPGGIGKTALLREFAEVARSAGVPALVVDGRDIEPAPEAFRSAVERGFQGAEGRRALVVDTYEALRALDGWLRRTLLPEADADLLIVLAERNPPDPA